jgi:DNA-binding MarR family transcriptional regulator
MYICVVKLEQALQTTKFKSNVHKAGLNILYTAWWLKTAASKTLKAFDLTHEQYNVLRILKGKHPEKMCVKDIAGRMIERNSNVPRIIDRLVEKALVIRTQSEQDGRQTVITVTPAGIELLAASTHAIETLNNQLLSISEPEADVLNQLLEKVRIKES